MPRRARKSLSSSLGGCEFIEGSYYRKDAGLGTASQASAGSLPIFMRALGARQASLEAGRMVGSDGEGAFERNANAAKRAFVEVTANQSDGVGNAAGRSEFWQRVLRVGGPVGARLADLDETGAKRERRMTGIVAGGEHFVAKRRDEQQIHIRENPRHFLADFAAEAVGLHEIHSRKKTGLAEKIGPGVVRLHFELIDAVGECEFFERGGTFSEKVEIEAAIRPVGEKDFDRAHAEFGDSFESGAVDIGGGSLLHPVWKIADAQIFDGGAGVEVEMAGNAGDIARIRTRDGLQDKNGVFNGARHWTELIERPAKGHGARTRDAAISGAKTGDAATHAGADNAAARFATDGEADESGRSGGAGPGAGAGSAFLKQPRIHGLPTEPNVIQSKRTEAQLRDENGAGVVEALHDGGVFCRNSISKGFGAVGGGDSGSVEKILATPGNTVERPPVFARGDFGVGFFRLRESEIAREGDDAAEFRIELLNSIEVDVREALGSELALLDPAREPGDGSVGDVGIVGRERARIGVCADEAVAPRGGMLSGEHGVVAREGG